MAAIFLSYAREDTKRVRPLIRALERSGHIVWWDERVPGGDQFTQAIQDALENADTVVVCWTAASVQSPWVRDEAAFGRDSGRFVPVTLDGSLPPLGFREFQAVDLSSWRGRPASRQVDTLNKAIAAKADHTAAERAHTVPSKSLKIRLAVAAAAAAALTAVGIVATGVVENSVIEFRQETPSIAVLPFADLSPAGDKAYFAEGVAEEILSTLAAEEGIKVIGRSSARQMERDPDPKAVRASLGVTHLLEGSTRTAGGELRVNVRLIDTKDGSQVWEEEYRGQLADIFTVQERIAATVTKRLRGTLFEDEVRSAKTTAVNAYQMYLAARSLARTRTDRSIKEALALARKVVEADPDYAPGQALLAELIYQLSNEQWAYGTFPVEQARRLALPHARKAIQLAPKAADGYAALGLVLRGAEQSIEPLRRAIQLDPSRADARIWLAISLGELGRHDEAIDQYRVATEVDPLWGVANFRYVQALAASGKYQDAFAHMSKYRDRGGPPNGTFNNLASLARYRGDLSSAVPHAQFALNIEADRTRQRARLAEYLYTLGLLARALRELPRDRLPLTALLYGSGHFPSGTNTDAALWQSPDAPAGFFMLARARDWRRLAAFHAANPRQKSCAVLPRVDQAMVAALRETGRADEAHQLLSCLRQRLAAEKGQRFRSPEHAPGELEFQEAGLAALEGELEKAFRALGRAIDRNWLGQPFSRQLTDYPQFDALRADPRFAAMQRRIDAKIARERAELLAQERSAKIRG